METNLNFPLILFDGYCNLCNSAVNFIIRHDRKRCFRFIALQSEAGNFWASKYDIPEIDSVVLIVGGNWFAESDAFLKIVGILGFPWNLTNIFRIVPKKIRDKCYREIAKNRYHWFGKRNTCRMPAPVEKDLFL